MTQDPISKARALIGAGKLQEAQAICHQLLARKSRDDNALGLLGVIAFRSNQFAEAADFFARAASSNTLSEQHALDLATCLFRAGRSDDAANAYRDAMRRFPSSVNVINEAGNGLLAMGRFGEAAQTYRKALASGRPEIHNNLGNALQGDRLFAEAIVAYREAIRLKPDYVEPHVNQANALLESLEFRLAVELLNRALQIQPNLPEAYLLLGIAHQNLFDDRRAIEVLQQALRLRPEYSDAHLELAKLLLRGDRLDEAIPALQRALTANPYSTEAQKFLAHSLRESGRHEEAREWDRKLGQSNDAPAASAFLFSLNYDDSLSAAAILRHHQDWADRFALPLASQILPLQNDRSADRRLRVGYVSPNLFDHPVGRMLLPLLTHRDREAFEVFCFSDARITDAVTAQLRAAADHWITTTTTTDAALADLIREQQIDILVDLAMHAPNNRLLTFARQPAPVQVTYLAYAGTTGLSTMDYRLTDPYLDPPGADDTIYVEQSWRLPRTFWCYAPSPEAPDVSPSPAGECGNITFGCLSNFAKVTEPAIAAWTRAMQIVPNSRFVMTAPAGRHREVVVARFASAGVDASRIRFIPRGPIGYFAAYCDIDIGFDTIGYAGGTTTLDALWMGVPVITLAGSRAIGRGGVSILSNLGLPEFIAPDLDAYVALSMQLAKDRPQLVKLRTELRTMLLQSPLMDATGFTREIEAAFRTMWERQCQS